MKVKVGQKVIFSDLSPWEVCTVKEKGSQKGSWFVDFHDGLSWLEVDEVGMREYTPENIEKYLGEYVAPSDELLA